MNDRCRLCTANDLDALCDELAEAMWQHHRGIFKRDCTFAEIGPYWTAVYRGLAEDAISLLRCPDGSKTPVFDPTRFRAHR